MENKRGRMFETVGRRQECGRYHVGLLVLIPAAERPKDRKAKGRTFLVDACNPHS